MIDERLDTLNTSLHVATEPGFTRPPVRRLPPGAVREAVLNGIVYRDWMRRDPIEATWIDEDSALQRDVRVALIVHTLLHHPFVTAGRLTGILHRGIPEVREAIETAADCRTGTEPLLLWYKDVWTLTWDAVAAAKRRASYDDLHRRSVLTYMRPDLDTAAEMARDWLTDHDRYTSGDHVNLTGLTYAGARGQLERLEQAGFLLRGPGSGRSAHFIAGPALA